jgi:hypothetical protein
VEEVLGMIKANELRIGNKVDYYGNIVTINYINDTDVGFSDYVPFDYPLLDEINPIPITEDWLVRFGFEYSDITVDFHSFHIDLMKTNNGKFITTDIIKCPELQHIHQLQNLYYALTGEELSYD